MMSNIKKAHGKPSLHVSVKYYLEYGCHVARLHRRRRRAYAPTRNTAAHGNHEKINSWVSFSIHGYGAHVGGPSATGASLPMVTMRKSIHGFLFPYLVMGLMLAALRPPGLRCHNRKYIPLCIKNTTLTVIVPFTTLKLFSRLN